jgi:hypothetical protein
MDFEWDFGSAASPSQPSGTIHSDDAEQRACSIVTVTSTPGRYPIYLSAENVYGTDGL